jgi:hypothetical protein
VRPVRSRGGIAAVLVVAIAGSGLLTGCGGKKTYDVRAVKDAFAAHDLPLSDPLPGLHFFAGAKNLRAVLTHGVPKTTEFPLYVVVFKTQSSAKGYADPGTARRVGLTVRRARNVVAAYGQVDSETRLRIESTIRSLR